MDCRQGMRVTMSKMLQAVTQERPLRCHCNRATQTAVKVLCRSGGWSVTGTPSPCQHDHVFSLFQVRKVHFDTQDHGPQTITGLEPKEVPLIHQSQGKGSTEWENSHYVSGYRLGLRRGDTATTSSCRCWACDCSLGEGGFCTWSRALKQC